MCYLCHDFVSHLNVSLAHLYVLNPMLQQNLNASSHTTEELIQQRQILNTVLIQQVIQA